MTPSHSFLCLPAAEVLCCSISLLERVRSVADVRGSFRLEYEFSELSKRIGFGELNFRKCTCSKLECRGTRGSLTPI